jgi:hypothetical protein
LKRFSRWRSNRVSVGKWFRVLGIDGDDLRKAAGIDDAVVRTAELGELRVVFLLPERASRVRPEAAADVDVHLRNGASPRA